MKSLTKKLIFSVLSLFLATGVVNAATWTIPLPDHIGPLSSGDITETFASPISGTGTLSFDLLGYLTLDGANNGYDDTFTLSVNGTPILSGLFALGGGGENQINFIPTGSSVDTTNTFPGIITSTGGDVKFILPLVLIAGLNSITFDYGQLQAIGDEAWGYKDAVVTITQTPIPAAIWLFSSAVISMLGISKRLKQASA